MLLIWSLLGMDLVIAGSMVNKSEKYEERSDLVVAGVRAQGLGFWGS